MATFREKYGIAVDDEIPVIPNTDERFNANCDRYRTMMKANEWKSFEECRDAINNFRAGIK